MKSAIVSVVLALSLCLLITQTSNASTPTYLIRQIKLSIDMTGWNGTNPGPTVQVIQGEDVVFVMESHGQQDHTSMIDAYGISWNEGMRGESSGAFLFDHYSNTLVGNFTYYDMDHPIFRDSSSQDQISPRFKRHITRHQTVSSGNRSRTSTMTTR